MVFVGLIIGFILILMAIAILMLILGVCIGLHCKHNSNGAKENDSVPVYEEVLEQKRQEKITLSKNTAYKQVVAL